MGLITIDEGKCTRCGFCARACPAGIISMGDGFPETIEKIEKGCITCGHCVAVCPTAALNHSRMMPQECAQLSPGWRLTPSQVEQLIKGRRSVRNFRTEPIEAQVIADLLEIVRYAPTGMNSQNVSWKAVLDEQEVQALSLAVIQWLGSVGDDFPYSVKGILKALEMGRDPILRKAPALMIAHGTADDPLSFASATIALATLDLAALPFGLGTCWAGFLTMAAASSCEVATALGLPPGHRMYGGMMIGYPAFEYARIPTRNPARVTWG
ncbi:MAG: 4Fe-4S binding protein [Geobacteraceae bacterium]|nr:4Fe-4S binding protein [Geobacteraceae bacterium]